MEQQLFVACKNGDLEKVKYLVSLGVDIQSENDWAVQLASSNGHLEVVKYLVSIGADIRCENDYAVRVASGNGDIEMVKYLVSLGADIRSDDDYAIQWASINGYLEMVKYLVSLGADIRSLTPKQQRYILFCLKMEEKKKERAEKKIYYWVQEYVLSRPAVVDRMAERSYLLSQKGEMIN